MTSQRSIATIERDLTAARMTFNVARINLKGTLVKLAAREGAEDRLIASAEEYGVDHTLGQLAANPVLFDLGAAPDKVALPAIRTALENAYEANFAADRLMAEQENLKRQANPAHHKAVLFAGRELELAASGDRGQFRDENAEKVFTRNVVQADSAMTDDHEDENERDR